MYTRSAHWRLKLKNFTTRTISTGKRGRYHLYIFINWPVKISIWTSKILVAQNTYFLNKNPVRHSAIIQLCIFTSHTNGNSLNVAPPPPTVVAEKTLTEKFYVPEGFES